MPLRLPGFHRHQADLTWLTEELAIGSAPSAADWPQLVAAGLRLVVDLRSEAADCSELALKHGLAYQRTPILEGGVPSAEELDVLTEMIVVRIQERSPVLVHCREGRGRSAMVCLAVLVRLGLPLYEAYRALTRLRPEVSLSETQVEAVSQFAARIDKAS